MALLVLAAGTYVAYRIQRPQPTQKTPMELRATSADIEPSHHQQAA